MLHLAGGGVLLPEVPARDVVLDALLGQQVHSDLIYGFAGVQDAFVVDDVDGDVIGQVGKILPHFRQLFGCGGILGHDNSPGDQGQTTKGNAGHDDCLLLEAEARSSFL